MKLKRFNIPKFEEWERQNNVAELTLGAYRVEIRAFSWKNDSTLYKFAMSLSNCNALNIYTEKLFCKSFECYGDRENLKKWYNDTVENFHAFWENHIINTYFET